MKISGSAVNMAGERNYSSYQENRAVTAAMRVAGWNDLYGTIRRDARGVSTSEESKVLFEKLNDKKQQNQQQTGKSYWEVMLEKASEAENLVSQEGTEEEQMQQTLRSLLDMLKRTHNDTTFTKLGTVNPMDIQEVMAQDKHFSASVKQSGQSFGFSQQFQVVDLRTPFTVDMANLFATGGVKLYPAGGAGHFAFNAADKSVGLNAGKESTAWIRHTEPTSLENGQDTITFSATGVAKTASGKQMGFGIDWKMSKEFADSVMGASEADVILTDPIVITLNQNRSNVSDQKFYFDLDTKDGVNRTEDDWIFKSLKVWTTDAEGKGKLVELKGGSVGAIYFRSANTQFRLNNTNNMTNEEIRKREAFLRESANVPHMSWTV